MEWISINKDMPKKSETCFVTGIDENGFRFYDVDMYFNNRWCGENEHEEITHWMRFEPPKID